MTADYSTIAFDDSQAPIARITLNRPEKRNPIGPATNGELVHALKSVREEPSLKVAVLTGAGKAFSAGGDLSMMSGSGGGESPIPPASLVDLLGTMHDLGKPIIGMANGHALAGGLGLLVACDLVVAAEEATFGTTEIKVGLWPMMITAEIARNIGRKRALEMMLTGRRLSAEEAERIGLVNRVAPADRLEEETMALAGDIADKSPATMALGLRSFYAVQDMGYEEALRHLESELGKVVALEDAAEGLSAFFQKRKPVWKGR